MSDCISPGEPDVPEFRGPYFFLSNFCPAAVELDGVMYPYLENAFQAAKSLDPLERRRFLACSLGNAKRLGRRVTLRPGWDALKLDVMRNLLVVRFAAGSDLAIRLERTGDLTLIEGNRWNDTFWGVCRDRGSNWLGKLLMERRALNRA